MAQIMSYERWMKMTHGGLTSIRSSELKLVDMTLRQFHNHPAAINQIAIKQALAVWIEGKGSGRTASETSGTPLNTCNCR